MDKLAIEAIIEIKDLNMNDGTNQVLKGVDLTIYPTISSCPCDTYFVIYSPC